MPLSGAAPDSNVTTGLDEDELGEDDTAGLTLLAGLTGAAVPAAGAGAGAGAGGSVAAGAGSGAAEEEEELPSPRTEATVGT
jgi:hypothetical protein